MEIPPISDEEFQKLSPAERWRYGPEKALSPKQKEALTLLASLARYVMLFGGSRSGKTFLICRAIAIRALKASGSRHLITRFRFAHVKKSIWHGTWPMMMKMCFPQVHYIANKQDFFWTLPNGSEVWIGGLDDKERTEKILGNEYASIYPNEVSELVSWATIEKLKTRLAQLVRVDDPNAPDFGQALRQKFFADCNPPLVTHWAHRLFIEKREPEPPFDPLRDPENYVSLRINPSDNAANLSPEYLESLEKLSSRQRARFWEGRWGSANENALWTYELLERCRVQIAPEMLVRVVIGVDPSGTKGPEEEKRSDHVGIVVAGVGADGIGYVLEDCTVQAPPAVWGKIVVDAYQRHEADCVVAETNFGGAMVGEVIRSAASEKRAFVKFKEVKASRATGSKSVRAEPISTLYGDLVVPTPTKIRHVGHFPELEDQLCSFTTMGYMGDRSPDRADALIWALTDLFPGMTRRAQRGPLVVEGVSDYNPLRF